ncbi:hypothetical protein NQ314_019895 [Rhamnusium bicolor]|uniref:F-box domain-containing protein n=1 Tax=Rhamnusium bicolor TaxID=1586634 RepID=A0AAV8WLZ6_9CUCU|nr:hypothetical protein NQ314_019895 [Rhamnusium bicolor]
MDHIPVEILIKIISYLNTYDLMQFCSACENYKCFYKEKSIVRFISFSRKFELQKFHLYRFIITNINYTSIKVLNINCLYWIPNDELRKLISKLENLEVLHALDTKLGITERDVATYNKLKKLAVSIEDNRFHDPFPRFLNVLKSLCLKITVKGLLFNDIYQFFENMKYLEELWIHDDDESFYKIDYDQIAVSLHNLKKLVIKSKTVLPCYDFKYIEQILNKPEGSKRSIFEPREHEIEKSWEIFESLHKDLPCGPIESKTLFLDSHIKHQDTPTQGFRRARSGIQVSCLNHPFQSIAENLKNLRELEIFNCSSCLGSVDLGAYSLIGTFENLQKLTLDIPISLDGLFLKEIFSGSRFFIKCRHLQSVNFLCVAQNEKFIINLCQHLHHTNNLRDFRY